MARVTVDDCLDKVENRFQLVILAARRARQIEMGAEPRVDVGNSKPTVAALKEIAESAITADEIRTINIKPQVVIEEFQPIDVSLDD